jgi:hypothetical protein
MRKSKPFLSTGCRVRFLALFVAIGDELFTLWQLETHKDGAGKPRLYCIPLSQLFTKGSKSKESCPATAIGVNGKLADCCAGRGVDEATLKAAGVGTPML